MQTIVEVEVGVYARFFRPELIGGFDQKNRLQAAIPDILREIGRLAIFPRRLAAPGKRVSTFSVSDVAFESFVGRGIHKALGFTGWKLASLFGLGLWETSILALIERVSKQHWIYLD